MSVSGTATNSIFVGSASSTKIELIKVTLIVRAALWNTSYFSRQVVLRIRATWRDLSVYLRATFSETPPLMIIHTLDQDCFYVLDPK